MKQISISFRKDAEDYIRWLSELLDLSISDVVNDVVKNMMEEDLEEAIWGDQFTNAKEEWDRMVEEAEEVEGSEEEEGESEEEEEEEE